MTATEQAGSGGSPGGRPGSGSGSPSAGTAVTIVPAGDVRLLTGVLLSWQEPASGVETTVHASVDIAPTKMHGEKLPVWATVQAEGGDTIVLSAEARRGETAHILDLAGRVAAREPRRRSVRAPAHLDVDVRVEGETVRTLSGRTLDLSAGGCRIALEGGEREAPTLDAGQPTDVVIHLDRENRPQMSGYVHAVRPGGQVVIRFEELSPSYVEQIERYVYATLP
ncbi:PilZ domain-containing protein [Motilibacter aurantiacus]|uniref:PilZ domain-containing protein n=1 Tax=Motilibacter aurantiacus TaxID=2714955 RepID=UPI001408E261|nr:PilZ domain-containing protein [Motilibacter aurantiacus]NHC46258.1 PilZ domain-containing protein [Motilibacter aurantiacus]